jgi:predicted transcriptional regulator
MSKKELIVDAIRRLPEGADFSDAIEEIRIIERIEEGEEAADEGRVRRHEEVRRLVRSWALK